MAGSPTGSRELNNSLFYFLQVVDFFNGNLKRRRQKRKEAKAMMKLKRLSTIHSEANGAVIGDAFTSLSYTQMLLLHHDSVTVFEHSGTMFNP